MKDGLRFTRDPTKPEGQVWERIGVMCSAGRLAIRWHQIPPIQNSR